ncbi:MAG TPA: GNAT family N-acetyltransferase [Solirubrobacteraceae bacterium]|nr:GNAT family N-acetyltransferase [Solirubrobacteraceae bacterium]
MSEIEIREALTDDLYVILALYEQLSDERESARPTDRERSLAAFEQISADPARQLLLAERDGRIVGTLDLLIVPNLTHHAMPWAIVENVVVDVRERRTGAGRMLLSRAFEIARGAGCYKAQLLSGKHRAEAHAFYRDSGMEAAAEGLKIYFDRDGENG